MTVYLSKNIPRINKSPNREKGLTLVELLIAMTLGLFLLAGIVQVFLGSKRSFEVISAQSNMQESARFAVYFMANVIEHAGYNNEGDIQTNLSQFINNLDNPITVGKWTQANTFEEGAAVTGVENGAFVNSKVGTDAITLRLQGHPDGTMFDCEGRPLATDPAEFSRVSFYVSDDNELVCESFDGAVQQPAVVLVEGVENMQVLYGVAGLQSDLVSEYVPADSMAADDWINVIAVRIAVMSVSSLASLDTQALSSDYNLLDQVVVDPADGLARQVFTQTVALRNRTLTTDSNDN